MPRQLSAFVLAGVFAIMGSAPLPLWTQPDLEECSSPGVSFGGQFGTPAMIADTLVVGTNQTIADLQVAIDLQHTYIGDVVMDISSPSGTAVRLHESQGGAAENIELVYNDAGIANGLVGYDSGCHVQPSGPGALADFASEPTQGSWSLSLNDVYPTEDDGTLDSWCLRNFISVPSPPPSPVQDVGCVAGVSANLQVSWSNPIVYDEIRLSVDGALVATLAGTASFAMVPQPAGPGPFLVCVEPVVAGGVACPRCCTAQEVALNEIEGCSAPGLTIDGGPHVDSLSMTQDQVIADATVAVEIGHTWVGDLIVEVTSPQATVIRLHNATGGESDDLRAIFSDTGALNGSTPYDFGCYLQPSGPGALGDLNGENTLGAWNLTVLDNYPADDDGVLESWCVRTYSQPSATPAPSVSDLSCSAGTEPGSIALSWSNPVLYSSVRVYSNGAVEAELAGDATSYLVSGLPDGAVATFRVVGVIPGSVPSCPASCSALITLSYELFLRGDVNVDGELDISDPVQLLANLFGSPGQTALSCHDAADGNDDETINLADAVYLLGHLFASDPAPPPPHGDCGSDPTDSLTLTCQSYPPCVGFTDTDLVGHVLRRVGYGPTPSLFEDVLAQGIQPYLEAQLNPSGIDESMNTQLNSGLALLQPQTNSTHLQLEQLIRGAYSERQLQEQMTDFWETHFSTYFWTAYSYFARTQQLGAAQAELSTTDIEWRENQAFRAQSLGSFYDLVVTSATSPAMLIYLDNVVNVVGSPNENYARELLELHTLGVDNGYTQADIEELSRCFTGWTVCRVDAASVGDPNAPCLPANDPTGVWSFHFDPAAHDYGQKVLFANNPAYQQVIPARPVGSPEGVLDGFEVIAALVLRPETAEFISRKLIRKLVVDDPPGGLLAECIGVWTQTDGDIGEVVRTILESSEFLGVANRWSKVRTPMESLLATVRAYEGATATLPVLVSLYALDHAPFNFFTPDGFPEAGVDLLGTSKVLGRLRFSQLMYTAADPAYDLVGLLASQGVAAGDLDAIVDYFFELLFQSNYTDIDRELAVQFLSTDGTGNGVPLDPAAPDYSQRLEEFAVFLTGFPQFLAQ